MSRWLVPGIALVVAAVVALSQLPLLGLALRIVFVLASAAPAGAVLLLAIARLTGADWSSAAPASRHLLWFVPLAALVMLSATGVPLPPHLAIWSHPLVTAARDALALGALAWAGGRLRHGAGTTFAGVTLALYAAAVTPIAADWLLPAAPGHPVSAVGMMLFLLQFAAGCAAALPAAGERQRRDLALLLVAALIGLGYLGFMDYLIIWFGNLPTRVPFYLDRNGWLALAALVIGPGVTIASVAGNRLAFAQLPAAAGLILFVLWWIGAGVAATLLAAAILLGAMILGIRREQAHG